jgi:cupin 2 domain-containing protein
MNRPKVDAERTPGVTAGSLLADVPDRLEAERFDSLLTQANVRIERIVSTGQTTPPDKWYDQAWDEWVLLVSGGASLLVEHEDEPRSLEPGDHLFLPARVRHRVTWTAPDRPTVWLAIRIDGPTAAPLRRDDGRRR